MRKKQIEFHIQEAALGHADGTSLQKLKRAPKSMIRENRAHMTQCIQHIEENAHEDSASIHFQDEAQLGDKQRPEGATTKAWILGKERTGWWVDNNPGVYTRKFSSKNSTIKTTNIADDSGPLGQERIANTTLAIHAQFEKT